MVEVGEKEEDLQESSVARLLGPEAAGLCLTRPANKSRVEIIRDNMQPSPDPPPCQIST